MNKPLWETKENAFDHFVKHVLCVDERWEDVPDSAPLIQYFGSRRQFARWRTHMLEEFERLTEVEIYENLTDRLSNRKKERRGRRWKGYNDQSPSAITRAKENNPRGLESWYSLLWSYFDDLEDVFVAHIQFMIDDGVSWEMSCDYNWEGIQKSAFISKYAQISIIGRENSGEQILITSFRINTKGAYSAQIIDLKKEPKCSKFTRQADQEKWDALNYTKPSDMP